MNQLKTISPKQKSIALQKLVTSSPLSITKKVVSSVMHTLHSKIEERLNKDFDVIGYNIYDKDLTLEELQEAEKTIQYSMIPLESFESEKELLKVVALMTKPREESAQDVAFRCKMIAEKLAHYPADIFLHTCNVISSTKVFFPALAEFKMVGDYHYFRRKNLLDIVQKSIKKRQNNTKELENSA